MWFTPNLRVSLIPLSSPPTAIHYDFVSTKFGRILLGIATEIPAICVLYFVSAAGEEASLQEVKQRWPKVPVQRNEPLIQQWTERLFSQEKENEQPIEVAVQGTEFQVAVWQSLVSLECGRTCSYGQLAELMGRPKAVRAVANAVAKNEVSILIPCHRIVSQNGQVKYHWGGELKTQLLAYEATRNT